jgi:GDP-4-dehydro-6-deoxy-D-mannose reductase
LVTGASGFVGGHLRAELGNRAHTTEADVVDRSALLDAVRTTGPDAVVHLAAASSVASSWAAADAVWHVNVVGTVNVLDAVATAAPNARVLVVSSAEVYGDTADEPATEETPPAPVSPYAASKQAAEVACERARRVDGIDLVVARPFPHVGPGQSERFAVGSWVRQIVELETRGGGTLRVGNLGSRRDVTDVRDVCRAYALLLDPAAPAGVYNVSSERTVSMAEVVETLVRLARCPVEVVQEAERLRPNDVALLRGSAVKLREATGWEALTPLEQSLGDALDAARVAASQHTTAR